MFFGIEPVKRFQINWTVIIIALVNGAECLLFPAIERMLTIGTPITGFRLFVLFAELRETAADFTADLTSELTIVEIEEFGRRITIRTGRAMGYIVAPVAMLDGLQRMTMSSFEMSQQLLPIQGWLRRRCMLKRSEWVYVEVPVVRMFFLKSSLGLTSGFRLAKTS